MKTVVPRGTVGSNPTASARNLTAPFGELFRPPCLICETILPSRGRGRPTAPSLLRCNRRVPLPEGLYGFRQKGSRKGRRSKIGSEHAPEYGDERADAEQAEQHERSHCDKGQQEHELLAEREHRGLPRAAFLRQLSDISIAHHSTGNDLSCSQETEDGRMGSNDISPFSCCCPPPG